MAKQGSQSVPHRALKFVNLGMDTRQVIARFEAERQALATMDHPNIAKFRCTFSAGISPYPYEGRDSATATEEKKP